MFTLAEKLENELEIDGVIYEVNMSFDNVLRFLELVGNIALTDAQRIYYGVYTLLGIDLELDLEELSEIFQVLMDNFINIGEEQEENLDLEGNVMPEVKKEPTYDLAHDAQYIYASFLQAYGINLFEMQGQLDWREFKALLAGLPDDTKFKQVMDIRMRPYPKGKSMSEERKQLKDLKRYYALPNTNIEDD